MAEFRNIDRSNPPNLDTLKRLFGSGLLLFAVAILLVVVSVVYTLRVGVVDGTEVGFLLNKWSGEITVLDQSGTHIYNGVTHEFYSLDKTLQTLEMTAVPTRGERQGRDDLKIKTIDGSDVHIDLKIQYRIDVVDPAVAKKVLLTSGPKGEYKEKWARDYVRSITRDHLGELTTEEFYDASKRGMKVEAARQEANKRLDSFGIVINEIVIPSRPRFYAEYEEKIKQKKLADQAVLAEQSKAHAAKQRQQTLIVEETNRKNVAVEQFSGQMQQLVIKEKAEGERVRKEADAYYSRVTVGAGAELYKLQKEADAILARKKAEATGIEELKKALEGEGGRNMVKLEYARKLRGVTIEGEPFMIDSRTERFQHLGASTRPKGGSAAEKK